MKRAKSVLWYASGGNIARCGPFQTQVEAVNAMRLAPGRSQDGRLFPPDVFVWPEVKSKKETP